MNQQELNIILENHKKWLNGEDGGVRANLSNANLSNADLSNADLRNANLSYANLFYANLSNANLSNAILCYADLGNADLSNADLSNAELWSTIGNQREIITIQTNLWQIVYTKDVMQIGCQRHNIDDWFNFDDAEINKMDREALSFWKKWKPILSLIMERSA